LRAELAGYIPPRTPTEQVLADIWSDILKLPQVGLADNFFALGGHSLLATQVLARLRTAFQIELPLRSLFETPTLAALARCESVWKTWPGLCARYLEIGPSWRW